MRRLERFGRAAGLSIGDTLPGLEAAARDRVAYRSKKRYSPAEGRRLIAESLCELLLAGHRVP